VFAAHHPVTANQHLDIHPTLGPADHCPSVYRDSQCPARRRLACRRRSAAPWTPPRPPSAEVRPRPTPLEKSRVHHSGAHPTLSLACQ